MLQAVATTPLNAIASFLKNQLLNFEGFGVLFRFLKSNVGDVQNCIFIHVATRASLKEYLPTCLLVANPCEARENYWKIIKHAYIKRQFKFMYACKGYIPK